MLKEIKEGPWAFKDTIQSNLRKFSEIAEAIRNSKRVIVTACGTSYHAGLSLTYLIPKVANIPAYAVQASEFIDYGRYLVDSNTLLVALSQSGETTDTIEAVKSIDKNVTILAITNREGSTLEKIAQLSLVTRAGEEKAVAATKTYIAQLAAVYGIVSQLENRKPDHLLQISDNLSRLIEKLESEIPAIAREYKDMKDCFTLGLGNSFPAALEAALKLKETCGIHAEAYSIYEFRHGPISLESPNTFNIFIKPISNSRWQKAFDKVVENVKSANAKGLLIRTEETEENFENFKYITVPKVQDNYSIPYQITPIQLLAYYIAVEKGLNPDEPKFLTKVVSG